MIELAIIYLLTAAGMILVMKTYRTIARRFQIVDRPEERSAHNQPTIRGGGILFPFAACIWFVVFEHSAPWSLLGLLLVSMVSFIDDLKNVRADIRLLTHFVAVAMLFLGVGVFAQPWPVWLLAAILTVACINAVNFMDGINGMTAFYSLITLGSFSLLNNAIHLLSPLFPEGIPDDWNAFLPEHLVGVLFIALLIFTYFNVKSKGKTFAGDVGSIGIAFLLSWFMIGLMLMSSSYFWLLLFAVYGIDTSCTILIRLYRRENILKPHRLHLYQLLIHRKKWSHLKVAALYAAIQLAINITTIWITFSGWMNFWVFFLYFACLVLLYVWIRQQLNASKPIPNNS